MYVSGHLAVYYAQFTLVLCSMQVGKEHLGLKAITDVLQDLQYKVIRRASLLETKAKNMTRTLVTKMPFCLYRERQK